MTESVYTFTFSYKLNISSTYDYEPKIKPMDIFLFSVYSLVIISGVSGNALVIKWFYEQYKQKVAGSAFVMVLAVNDLFASMIVPLAPVHLLLSHSRHPIEAWYLGKMLCYTLNESAAVFLLTTSWTLIAIALERYK